MYGKDYTRYSELREAKKALETRLNIGGEVSSVFDPVDKPIHYNSGGIEAIEAIKAAVATAPPVQAVFVANILKYVWRYREKNGKQDLLKARWYLDALIQEVESQKDGKES